MSWRNMRAVLLMTVGGPKEHELVSFRYLPTIIS